MNMFYVNMNSNIQTISFPERLLTDKLVLVILKLAMLTLVDNSQ